MNKFLTAFILSSIVAGPALAVAETFRSGDRVEATAVFFMCGAREDLETITALDGQGDRQTAIKLGMERCQSARPGYAYFVTEAKGDVVCIRREGAPYCLWARQSSVRATPSQ